MMFAELAAQESIKLKMKEGKLDFTSVENSFLFILISHHYPT